MLRSLKGLEHYVVKATDGDVGRVVNFLVDDEHWVVRYLVVETAAALGRPRVLISPVSFREVEWSTHTFGLALTVDTVKNSPDLDTDQPVSRQHERDYSGYYGYPHYWGYLEPWGPNAYPALLGAGQKNEEPAEHRDNTAADVHLRSVEEVIGYHVHASDGLVGHIEDFIVTDDSWAVRYLVVDTSKWPMGRKVLVAPQWATKVSWLTRTVDVGLSREALKHSPEWNAMDGVNRAYEERLYDYYGRPTSWSSDVARTKK